MAKKTFKNPLNQAFGIILRRERESRSLSYDDVAKKSHLGASYIQQVEKGQFNLHASNCFALYNTFKTDVSGKGLFVLEGIMQLLCIISVLEAKGKDSRNYMKGLEEAARSLSDGNTKIGKLFEKFFEHKVFEVRSSEEAYDLIIENQIDVAVEDYLLNYPVYDKTPEERQQVFLRTFFDDVPSIFFEHIRDSKESILKLPFQLGFSGLWKWEERNKKNFKSLICVCDRPENVTSKINLSRYSYRYLWEKQFDQAQFIFFDTDRTANDIASEFKKNLGESFSESGDQELLKTLSNGVDKLKVTVAPKENKKVQSKIQRLLSDSSQASSHFNALWVFTLSEGYCVGFLAEIDPGQILVQQGISLNMNETFTRNEDLKEIWRILSALNTK